MNARTLPRPLDETLLDQKKLRDRLDFDLLTVRLGMTERPTLETIQAAERVMKYLGAWLRTKRTDDTPATVLACAGIEGTQSVEDLINLGIIIGQEFPRGADLLASGVAREVETKPARPFCCRYGCLMCRAGKPECPGECVEFASAEA